MPAGHGSTRAGAASLGYQRLGGGWTSPSTCPALSSLAEPRTTWGSRRRYVSLLALQQQLSLVSGEGNLSVDGQTDFVPGAHRFLGEWGVFGGLENSLLEEQL